MSSMEYLFKALLAEYLGTTALVFIGAGTVASLTAQGANPVNGLGAALAFGLALIGLIAMFQNYSGAHLNPGVSLSFLLTGRMPFGLSLLYMLMQFLGGITAGALIAFLWGNADGAGAPTGSLTETDQGRAFFTVFLFSMFFNLAYLLIYKDKHMALTSGLLLGFIFAAVTLGGYSLVGASVNPASSLGTSIFGNTLSTVWIYIVAPLAAALVAALIYHLMCWQTNCSTKMMNGCPVKDACGNPVKECVVDKVDGCGNPVVNAAGKTEKVAFLEHEKKYTHHQESPLLALAGYMSANGLDPRYVRQELTSSIANTVKTASIPVSQPAASNMTDTVVNVAKDTMKSMTAAGMAPVVAANAVVDSTVKSMTSSSSSSRRSGSRRSLAPLIFDDREVMPSK